MEDKIPCEGCGVNAMEDKMLCGNCGALGDPDVVRKHFDMCMGPFIIPKLSIAENIPCQHHWIQYDPRSANTIDLFYCGEPKIYQICVNCYLKRVGYPQPIRWEYPHKKEENANLQK